MSVKYCPTCHGTGHVLNHRAIGGRMKRLRLARHVKLREMARKLDLSPSYVSQLEHGDRAWPPALLDRYAKQVGE